MRKENGRVREEDRERKIGEQQERRKEEEEEDKKRLRWCKHFLHTLRGDSDTSLTSSSVCAWLVCQMSPTEVDGVGGGIA